MNKKCCLLQKQIQHKQVWGRKLVIFKFSFRSWVWKRQWRMVIHTAQNCTRTGLLGRISGKDHVLFLQRTHVQLPVLLSDCLQLLVTPALGNLIASSGFCKHPHSHMHISTPPHPPHPHTPHTHIQIKIKINSFKKCAVMHMRSN